MKLKPLSARVILKRETLKQVGKIIIPDEAQQRHAKLRCKVIAVGPTADKSIEVGMTVLIARYSGDWMTATGEAALKPDQDELYVVQDEDLLAIVEEDEEHGRRAA